MTSFVLIFERAKNLDSRFYSQLSHKLLEYLLDHLYYFYFMIDQFGSNVFNYRLIDDFEN